jgi:hypothetical protein
MMGFFFQMFLGQLNIGVLHESILIEYDMYWYRHCENLQNNLQINNLLSLIYVVATCK